jgi:transposase
MGKAHDLHTTWATVYRERAVKPFVIGRKNWLFSNTASGAKASAILYSIIETAKANDLNPVKYVEHLLTEIPKRNEDDSLEALMPWWCG